MAIKKAFGKNSQRKISYSNDQILYKPTEIWSTKIGSVFF